jgi:hypothetical protein
MLHAEKHMIGAAKAIKILGAAAAVVSWLTFPAYPQAFNQKHGGSGPPVESHPKVDEKAYKAALDRIPVSSKKYDPWGIARPSEPASVGKKSN